MKDARSVVRKALITEKGTVLREVRNQYHFEVARDANKISQAWLLPSRQAEAMNQSSG